MESWKRNVRGITKEIVPDSRLATIDIDDDSSMAAPLYTLDR